MFYISGADRIMDQSLPRYNQLVVYKAALDTLETTEVFDPKATVGWIELSPTNPSQLAVWTTPHDWTAYTNVFTLVFMDLSTGQSINLATQDVNACFTFSPDGHYLAFTNSNQKQSEVCFLSVDTTTVSCTQDEYFKSGTGVGLSGWLPDSHNALARRYYIQDEVHYWDVILVRPDGTYEETLASSCTDNSSNPLCSVFQAVWNPNYRGP